MGGGGGNTRQPTVTILKGQSKYSKDALNTEGKVSPDSHSTWCSVWSCTQKNDHLLKSRIWKWVWKKLYLEGTCKSRPQWTGDCKGILEKRAFHTGAVNTAYSCFFQKCTKTHFCSNKSRQKKKACHDSPHSVLIASAGFFVISSGEPSAWVQVEMSLFLCTQNQKSPWWWAVYSLCFCFNERWKLFFPRQRRKQWAAQFSCVTIFTRSGNRHRWA